MSKQASTTTASKTVAGPVLIADSRVSLKQTNNTLGDMKIIRPSELADAGITGTVAKGIFEKMEPNKFDTSKNDYFLRDGETLYIVNTTKSLKEQLEQPGVIGMFVEIVYEGKVPTKNKKGFHQFEVYATKVKAS
jgi:hypothetical protein